MLRDWEIRKCFSLIINSSWDYRFNEIFRNVGKQCFQRQTLKTFLLWDLIVCVPWEREREREMSLWSSKYASFIYFYFKIILFYSKILTTILLWSTNICFLVIIFLSLHFVFILIMSVMFSLKSACISCNQVRGSFSLNSVISQGTAQCTL